MANRNVGLAMVARTFRIASLCHYLAVTTRRSPCPKSEHADSTQPDLSVISTTHCASLHNALRVRIMFKGRGI